jgi:protein involved in polysaccharide export with SLBB domain
MMMKLMKTLVPVLLLLALAASSGEAQTNPPAAAGEAAADTGSHAPQTSSTPQFQTRYPRYKIGSGDSFDVNFELSPEFNQTVTVQPDGFITLRGVGDVNVAGQTVPELTQTLKQAYSKILNDPQIVVMLKDFEKPYFIADGQVGRPGKYDLRGDVTVTEAVAMAGGFTEAAKHSQVLLFRRVSDEWTEAKIINIKKMLKDGNLHEDLHVHSGDMIVVPKNTMSKIQRYIPNSSMGAFTQFGKF